MKILQLHCSRSAKGYVSYKFRAPASRKSYMYVCMCMCKVCMCEISCVYLPVCVSSEACLSARVAHFNVIACACLAATCTAHPHPLSVILGSCFVVVVALVSLCNSPPAPPHPIPLPADVAFKRISPSAITVVEKCQLFWLLKRVPDRRTPRGARALWSLVPAAAAVHEASKDAKCQRQRQRGASS